MTVPASASRRNDKGVLTLFHGALHDLSHRPQGNIAWLDVLRSSAILLVFLAHFAGDFNAPPAVAALPVFYWGWTGVDLFFILSGLLIGTQLWKELRDTGRIQIGRFLLRRGFRIWPLYYALVAFLLMEVLLFHRPANNLQADVFFVSNYFHCQIGGGWSLSTEEQFYILAPVCLYLFSRRLQPRQCWVFPAAGLLILPLLRAIHIHGSTLNHDLKERLYFPFHLHSDGLALGLLIAWLRVFHPVQVRSSRFRLIVCLAMLLVAAGLYVISPAIFNFSSIALIWGALTFWGVEFRAVPAVLNWNGFYLMSRLSYGLYLNHFGLLERFAAFAKLTPRDGSISFWLWMLLCFLVCLAFSALTFQLIEWPFLQLRSRMIGSVNAPRQWARSST